MEILIATLVSAVVELVKRYVGTSRLGTLVMLVAVSFAAAGVMTTLQAVGLWDAFVRLAIMAAGIFALFLQHVPKSDA